MENNFRKLIMVVCLLIFDKVLYLSKGGDIILNQIVLVGRLTRDITVNKSEKGVKVATISLAIPRSFKNMEGGYDTDFIDCVAFDGIAENTSQYCSKGDIVGVKGRIQSRVVEKDNEKKYLIEIIAEKVTFLSSTSKKADE